MYCAEMESEEIPATHSKDTTPIPPAVKPAYTGRPRQSPAWNFFSFIAAKSRSVCEVQIRVVDSTTKLCGVEISGKYPTNLKAHLKTAHPQVFAEVSTAVCSMCAVCCVYVCVVCACVHCAVCVRMCMSTVTSLSVVLS